MRDNGPDEKKKIYQKMNTQSKLGVFLDHNEMHEVGLNSLILEIITDHVKQCGYVTNL